MQNQDQLLLDVKTTQGQYDLLYLASGILWPSKPGRMVELAAKTCSPGRGLDLGCGDGKNLVYLEQLGWVIDGFDISNLAINACYQRLSQSGKHNNGQIQCENVIEADIRENMYDLVISYGLYHCLNDFELQQVHMKAVKALKSQGVFAYAALNDDIPVPVGHCTGELYLRPKDHILSLFDGWNIIALQFGEIEEEHRPLVGKHKHSLSWGLFSKP